MSKNGYDFYLDKCLLPITPQKLQIKINSANSTVTLINEGEVNLLKNTKLTDIEFECEIPQVKYPFAVYPNGFKGASYYLDYFENLKTDKKPFQFIVSRSMPTGKSLFSTNIKVSMESYTITEQAKNGFDLTVKIKLKQYREYGTKTATIKTESGKTSANVQNKRADSTVQSSKPATIGCDVIVNGRLHGNSYGEAPGQMRTDYRGKINFINPGSSHPYHITTPDGLWQGWVTADSVKVV
ncbi:MAG: hydrolase [Ruminococcaceae bacterium]|nr:hydrolase [Oscillospiraceae bacterium]